MFSICPSSLALRKGRDVETSSQVSDLSNSTIGTNSTTNTSTSTQSGFSSSSNETNIGNNLDFESQRIQRLNELEETRQARIQQDKNNSDLMKTLLQKVKSRSMREIYQDQDMYFLFHRTCVVNVIFKMKWRKSRTTTKFTTYVTTSDEAFAFLILENNADRYLDMASGIQLKNCSLPEYTDINGNAKLNGRGWSWKGIKRYMEIHKFIEDIRENEADAIDELALAIQQKYISIYCPQGTSVDECNDIGNDDGDIECDAELNEFLRNSSKRPRLEH